MKLFKRRAKPDRQPDDVQKDVQEETSESGVETSTPEHGGGPDEPAEETGPGVFERLRSGLSKSRGQFTEGLASVVLGKKQLDPRLLEALEEQLEDDQVAELRRKKMQKKR